MRTVDAAPKASILIESMRDVGYSLESALADVVDNSISAGASTVHVYVEVDGANTRIGIVDDGRGMSREELLDAMRLGSRHPHATRDANDLGRFGLGLKTASFSQCRRLTVVARQGSTSCAAIWDLDHVARTDSWSLLVPDSPAEIPLVEHIGDEGVLVLWERLDRAIEQGGSEAALKLFNRRIDDARSHLELVFHRYLSGERGTKRVQILINNLPLEPFDPFHSQHPATIKGQTEKVQVGNHVVEITPFTLPHNRNVTAAQWSHYAGKAGYLKNQGFYLYREKRLIVHGTWFGLARQMELTKLSRVRIDMPNALDLQWHVDVKKSSARPPIQVRERLQRIVGQIGAPSIRIYEGRGRKLYSSKLPLWDRVQANNQIVYRLNPDNPVIAAFAAGLAGSAREDFTRLLVFIGAGLPMDAIFADLAGTPENVGSEPVPADAIRDLLRITWYGLLAGGSSSRMIPEMLRVTEPFRSNWELVEAMLPEFEEESGE